MQPCGDGRLGRPAGAKQGGTSTAVEARTLEARTVEARTEPSGLKHHASNLGVLSALTMAAFCTESTASVILEEYMRMPSMPAE